MGRDFDRWHQQYQSLVKSVLYDNGIVPEDIEDRCQEVWAAFFAGGYDKLYTPSKGSESNFMFNFVERRCRGWRRQQSQDKLRQAVRLAPVGSMDGYVGHELSLDSMIELSTVTPDDVDFRLAVRAAEEALCHLPVAGKRDLHRLFSLFLEGYTQREIAKLIGVAEGTVSNYVKMLRQVPEVLQLRDDYLAA